MWHVPGKWEGRSVRLSVTSTDKQCGTCTDANPKPEEKQDSTEATLPTTGVTVTTSTRGWKRFRKAATAEIAMCCFHIKHHDNPGDKGDIFRHDQLLLGAISQITQRFTTVPLVLSGSTK